MSRSTHPPATRRAPPTGISGNRQRSVLYSTRGSTLPLLALLAALATPVLAGAGSTPRVAAALAAVDEVAPGVFVHVGQIAETAPDNAGDTANWGFVVGSRCAAVIDTGGSAATGAAVLHALRDRTALPLCAVIVTHGHPDHLLGLPALATADLATADAAQPRPAPRQLAHHRLPTAVAARASSYAAQAQRQLGLATPPRIITPAEAVSGDTSIDLGGRQLQLRAWKTAHTDHDLTVFDAATQTLFAGDLLFVGHLPVVDGSLNGWLMQTAALRQLGAQRTVPGHGPVVDASGWDAQTAYLNTLRDAVREALRRRLPLRQVVTDTAAPSGWALTELFHRRNLTAAYSELEWEEQD